jgi:carbon-monoxide dehydrogenase large subunit
VHAQDVGGGFGIRGNVYPEHVAVMIAARRLGAPVKWVASRSETFLADYHGRAIRLSGELALDACGQFLAMRLEWLCDLGAYPAGAGPFVSTYPPSTTPTGVYRVPAVYGRNRLVITNTVPITAYRGAGRPDGAYLIERMVEEAARETGIDRIELRRRNLIPSEDFPYTTPTRTVYDSGDYATLLDKALQASGWSSFEARRAQSKAGGRLRGIGCAVFVEPSGPALSPKDQAMLKFGPSGGMQLFSVSGPSGQGHETVLAEIAARELGVDPESITARIGDPDGPALIGGGTAGSRSMSAHGSASLMAAREAISKGMELASRELEVAPQDLEFVRGAYRVKGTDKAIGLVDLAKKHAGGAMHPMDAGGEVAAAPTFPSGVHVAEVEIDPDTGTAGVLAYTTMDDCGNVINHTLLEGQMHGGIMQGAGQVFGEECLYDRASGQLLTGSFMDYTMPRADWIARMSINEHPVPSPNNPLGVKGAGEAGTTGSLPTLMNAVLDALAPAGIEHLDMPVTPAKIWLALRRAKASGGR